MPSPVPRGIYRKTQYAYLNIPKHPEAGKIKIDMFIAAKTISRFGIEGYGNDRTFDPNEQNGRTKVQIYLDFTTGVGTLYAAPSCLTTDIFTPQRICTDAYGFSGDLGWASNGLTYRDAPGGGVELKYSFENSIGEVVIPGIWYLEELMNDSIDGDLVVGPDEDYGWSRPKVTGSKDAFPSFAVYQFPPEGGVRVNCEIPESGKGVTALGDPSVALDGQCRQLSPGGMSMGSR